MLQNKLLFFLIIFFFWLVWSMLAHTYFEEIQRPPSNLKTILNKGPGLPSEEHRLNREWSHRFLIMGTEFSKGEYSIWFSSPASRMYWDSEVNIFTYGPHLLDTGGLRSFFPLKQTEVWMVRSDDLVELKHLYFFNMRINCIALQNDTLYFRYNKNQYGKYAVNLRE